MFSFLAPSLLWLAPLIAVPIAIALLGRAQAKTRDFPSLLPVRESLQRAMRKHRLKNWLQLILRTLAILFLLLAAAGPVWRTGAVLQPPRHAVVWLHNGAYGALPSTPSVKNGGNLLASQEALLTGLDSLTGGHAVAEPLFPDVYAGGAGTSDGRTAGRMAARFGNPADGFSRLFTSAGNRSGEDGNVHVYVPVFDSRDLAALARIAGPWLETKPRARLIVLDHRREAARLRAIGSVWAVFEKEGMVSLRAAVEPNAVATASLQPPVWTPARSERSGGGPVRAARLRQEGGATWAEVSLPVPENPDGSWIAGTLSLTEADSARLGVPFASVAAVFRVPPPATLCHVGGREAVASLATLGTGGPRLKIRALVPGAGSASSGSEDCDLLYLADPPDADAALLQRAAAVLRSGGKVILETGRRTDPVLWNRSLLVPLGIGRLTTVIPSATAKPTATLALSTAANALGGARGDRWGYPGSVTDRFGFLPSTGTSILVSTKTGPSAAQGAILVHHRIGRGELLLWTTSLSDPAWSDIGLGPWPALAHQAFLSKAWAAGIESRAVDSDSLLVLSSNEGREGSEISGRRSDSEDAPPEVIDPDGTPFRGMRPEPGGWVAGPFNRPGLYRVGSNAFAVQLADPPGNSGGGDGPSLREQIGDKAWKQTVVLEGRKGTDWRGLYGGLRLRPVLLAIAALLLFAEGVVSLRLTHFSESR